MRYNEIISERQIVSTNSKGQPIAHTPQSLQNFWSWFGKSKVVDKFGQPLALYHGTKTDFSKFDPNISNKSGVPIQYRGSFFFTNMPDVAQSYAGQKTDDWGFATDAEREQWKALAMSNDDDIWDKRHEFWKKHAIRNVKSWKDGANVMPVYLKMIKPLRINGRGENWSDVPFENDYWATRDLVELAMDRGYDGLIVRNVHDRGEGKGKPSDIYVVFSPNQIKSAIGNAGKFSASDAIDEEALTEIEIGGGVDSSFIDDIKTNHAPPEGFQNKQRDLFPDIPTLDPNLPKHMTKLGNIGNLTVVDVKETTQDQNEMTLVLFDRENPIGWIALGPPKRGFEIEFHERAGSNAKGMQTYSVYLDPSHRGQNLSIALYRWILTHICDYLVADELQTWGGVKIWRKALNSKAFDVMVFDQNKYESRKRWAGKDFNHVYNTYHLIPWMTLKGKADKLMYEEEE